MDTNFLSILLSPLHLMSSLHLFNLYCTKYSLTQFESNWHAPSMQQSKFQLFVLCLWLLYLLLKFKYNVILSSHAPFPFRNAILTLACREVKKQISLEVRLRVKIVYFYWKKKNVLMIRALWVFFFSGGYLLNDSRGWLQYKYYVSYRITAIMNILQFDSIMNGSVRQRISSQWIEYRANGEHMTSKWLLNDKRMLKIHKINKINQRKLICHFHLIPLL